LNQQVPTEETYRYGLGRARFAQGRYQDALADLREVTGETEPLRSRDFRSQLVFRLAGSQQVDRKSYVRTWKAYDVLRTWLVEQEALARGRTDRAGMADAQAALLWLVRDHYWRWRQREHAPEDGGGAVGSDRGGEPLEPDPGDEPFGDHLVTRLVLRADAGLFPEGEKTPALRRWSEDLPDLARQIKEQVGVTLPGLVVLAEPALPAGAYELLVNGQRVGAGRLRPAGWDRPDADRAGAGGAGMPPSASGDGRHRLGDREPFRSGQREPPLEDPHAVIFEHLRAVAWSHLDAFVRFQEVADLIDGWCAEHPSGALAPAALHPDVRPRLVEVIRALLQERVPVLALDVICERFADADRHRRGLDGLVWHVRHGLLEVLPGNQPGWQLLGLSPEFEEAIQRHLAGPGEVLALPAKEANRMRAGIRAALDRAAPGPVALVVGRPELRPFFRRLVQADRPDLGVLSADELVEDRGSVRPVVRVPGRGRAPRRGDR
jgi:FHIPEP family